MVTPAPAPPVAAGQERPGEHWEPPRRHEDHRGADVGLRLRPAAAALPDLGGELGHLPRDQGRGDPAPLELLDMEQAGGRSRGHLLTIQRRQQPPPPGRRSGGHLVPALQPLVLEQAAAATDTGDTASVLEEAHHGSFSLQKLQGRRYRTQDH